MAPSRHNNQPSHRDPLPAYSLGQRQQNVQRHIDSAGGELTLEFATLGSDDTYVDARRAAGDATHELRENGGLQRVAHANDEALARAGWGETVDLGQRHL